MILGTSIFLKHKDRVKSQELSLKSLTSQSPWRPSRWILDRKRSRSSQSSWTINSSGTCLLLHGGNMYYPPSPNPPFLSTVFEQAIPSNGTFSRSNGVETLKFVESRHNSWRIYDITKEIIGGPSMSHNFVLGAYWDGVPWGQFFK